MIFWKALAYAVGSEVASVDNWEGGGNIRTLVFTDLKDSWFQKKLTMENITYEYSPLQLSTLATLLAVGTFGIPIHWKYRYWI